MGELYQILADCGLPWPYYHPPNGYARLMDPTQLVEVVSVRQLLRGPLISVEGTAKYSVPPHLHIHRSGVSETVNVIQNNLSMEEGIKWFDTVFAYLTDNKPKTVAYKTLQDYFDVTPFVEYYHSDHKWAIWFNGGASTLVLCSHSGTTRMVILSSKKISEDLISLVNANRPASDPDDLARELEDTVKLDKDQFDKVLELLKRTYHAGRARGMYEGKD